MNQINVVVPSALVKQLYKTKNKNDKLANVIKSGLNSLKDKIKEMSENKIEMKNHTKYLKLLKYS